MSGPMRCGMSEVKVDPASLADGVTELPCPECTAVVHVGGTPEARYAIHNEPWADGWGISGAGDWTCPECFHNNDERHGRCWSCGADQPDEPAAEVSIGDTLQQLAEGGFFTGCCREENGVVTHDAADMEHGVAASLRLLDGTDG